MGGSTTCSSSRTRGLAGRTALEGRRPSGGLHGERCAPATAASCSWRALRLRSTLDARWRRAGRSRLPAL